MLSKYDALGPENELEIGIDVFPYDYEKYRRYYLIFLLEMIILTRIIFTSTINL